MEKRHFPNHRLSVFVSKVYQSQTWFNELLHTTDFQVDQMIKAPHCKPLMCEQKKMCDEGKDEGNMQMSLNSLV